MLINDLYTNKKPNLSEGMAGKVMFSGTGANGGTYEIIQSGDGFMIHANGKHIDTYGSLQRAMSVLQNEVPGLQQGMAEGTLDEAVGMMIKGAAISGANDQDIADRIAAKTGGRVDSGSYGHHVLITYPTTQHRAEAAVKIRKMFPGIELYKSGGNRNAIDEQGVAEGSLNEFAITPDDKSGGKQAGRWLITYMTKDGTTKEKIMVGKNANVVSKYFEFKYRRKPLSVVPYIDDMDLRGELDNLGLDEQGVAEAQTDYQKRRQRERDVDAGKPVKPEPRNPPNDYFARRKKEKDLAEDDDAVAAFLARGGEVQRLKPAKPRKGERWQGSSHIGAAGGRGTKGRVSGLGANTGKSGKPVVTAEDINDPYSVVSTKSDMTTKDANGKPTQVYKSTTTATDPSTGKFKKMTSTDDNGKTSSVFTDPEGNEHLDEVSLGDYRKKATVNKAMAQTNKFFGRDDPAAVAAADRTIAKRERGLGRADARRQPYTAPPVDQDKQRRDLADKYPNIDELVRQAELNRDPQYDRADGQAYYDGRDAEQNYHKLKQIQRMIRGTELDEMDFGVSQTTDSDTGDVTTNFSQGPMSVSQTKTPGGYTKQTDQQFNLGTATLGAKTVGPNIGAGQLAGTTTKTATNTATGQAKQQVKGVGFGGASGATVGKNYVGSSDDELAKYAADSTFGVNESVNRIRHLAGIKPAK